MHLHLCICLSRLSVPITDFIGCCYIWSNVHFEFRMPFLRNTINILVELSPTPLVAKPETIITTRQRLVNLEIQNKKYVIAFCF